MMTKKDYQIVANVFWSMVNDKAKLEYVLQFAKEFKRYNPRFDEDKFFVACRMLPEAIQRIQNVSKV